jgi:mono/diheme cytochrome c family protein
MPTQMRPVVCSVATLSLVTLFACSKPETTTDHMQRHFDEAGALKMAVIAGDLEASKEPAEWLANHESVQGLPGEWEPYLTGLQDAARKVAQAEDIADAAAATGEMGISCGACHLALDQGAQFAFMAPPEQEGVTGHMLRHDWASDRMWDGLVGPSDEEWTKGVEGLGESPLLGGSTEAQEFARRVHELGEQALEAPDPAARAVIYGQLIAACAGCHRVAGDGPASRSTELGGLP